MASRGDRRPGTVVAAGVALLLALLLALSGCSRSSAEPEAEPSGAETAFDPLAFEEPEMPLVDGHAERRADVEKAVEYFADAWTYGLRTGYAQPFNKVCSSSTKGCDEVRDELVALSESGHHVEMEPIEVEVVRMSPLRQHHFPGTRLVATIAPVLVEVALPERVERDADGREVGRDPAEERRLGLVFVSEPAYHGWVVYRWYDPELDADAA
jgi:Family of unknown function (DUF6318)